MTKQRKRRLPRRSFSLVAILLAAGIFAALATPSLADEGPKPDPSGIATGDKTTAVDAAGNSFAVPEPTDKTAPDYATNKKAFDDYRAQAAKEPLAVKLADAEKTIAAPVLLCELWLYPRDSRVALNGSGLLIVNPPYQFDQAAREWLRELGSALGAAAHGGTTLRWIVHEAA